MRVFVVAMEEDYKIIDNIIYTPNYDYEPDARGIGWVYFEKLRTNKDRLAQVDGLTGKKDTFNSLLERCVRIAIGLKLLGVKYGDVISICTYNHLNSCVPHISAMFVGAKMAALDPSLPLTDAVYLFKIAKPKVIFVDSESIKLIENVVQKVGSETILVAFEQNDRYISFSQLLKPYPEEIDFKPTIADNIKDVVVILFSSGTSGFPKGICHTHHSLLRDSTTASNLGSTSAFLYGTDSPYWNLFLTILSYSIINGTTRVIYSKFDQLNPWQIFSHKLTTAFLNLTELMILYYTPKPESIDVSELQILIVTGSPVSKQHITKAKTVFPNTIIRISYGQTEVFPNILCFEISNPKHVDLLKRNINVCGFPKRGVTYKIVDLETNKALGPNQKGELRIKTEMQLSGYYNMDSSDIWDADGWLKTGDYGYYDKDYCFYIVDRIKEMFKYQDWHIIPAVLESILVTHPAILIAVVIGVPHEVDEHHPMAFVQLKPESSATEDEIRKYFDEKVENRQKLRGGVKFLKNIPLTPTGKPNRRALKKMILQNTIYN